MALTPTDSAEYLASTTEPVARVSTPDWGGRLEVSKGSLVHTVAGQGVANMVKLPAGRLIIFPDLCRIVSPQGVTSSVLDVGLGAFTKMDGTTQAADGAVLANDLAVGVGAIDQALPLPAVGYLVVESKSGVVATITYATANGPASGEAVLILVYGRAK